MNRQIRPSSSTSATSDPSSLIELKGLDNPALSIDTNEIDSGLWIVFSSASDSLK